MFLSGYARLDYRLTEEGQFYLLEAKSQSAELPKTKTSPISRAQRASYDQLLQKIMTVGMKLQAATQGS